SKVQVFDEKTEQARLTGIDDGDFDRAMNLELRQEFKTGKFGKATVGAGTLERLVASANYNRFSTKNQLSFIGYANNINQTGVNWEDYGQFLGSNAFRQFDTGDFGFENRRGGRHSVSFRDAPISFDDGMGLTKN
ncbi:hypothetical protein RZS08_33785, partial [Arthrospira platensis SPKY1]|nr:hypothetical protein [Arthrospira platensis SPKY1]